MYRAMPASDPLYRPHTTTVAVAIADTEYTVNIPHGGKNIVLRLENAGFTWRWSSRIGEVAGGGGFPLEASEDLAFEGPMHSSTVYFAVDGVTTLHVTYDFPAGGL
jgi:hypothetical protein